MKLVNMRDVLRIEKLYMGGRSVGAIRNEEQSELLDRAARLLKKYNGSMGITRNDGIIMDYLARNPRAVIFTDKNVAHAFTSASTVLAFQAREDAKCLYKS